MELVGEPALAIEMLDEDGVPLKLGSLLAGGGEGPTSLLLFRCMGKGEGEGEALVLEDRYICGSGKAKYSVGGSKTLLVLAEARLLGRSVSNPLINPLLLYCCCGVGCAVEGE